MASPSAPGPARLALCLLMDWAAGATSSRKLCKRMGNATKDGLQLHTAQRLASIGSGGPAHAAQNRLKLLKWCGGHGQLTTVKDIQTTHIVQPYVTTEIFPNSCVDGRRLCGAAWCGMVIMVCMCWDIWPGSRQSQRTVRVGCNGVE